MRRLAAEVSYFIPDDDGGEAWLAHKLWFGSLQASKDVIITFNHDRVIEHSAEMTNRKSLVVVTDGKFKCIAENLAKHLPSFKMHRSVGWHITSDNEN